jgi:hypothetical protein
MDVDRRGKGDRNYVLASAATIDWLRNRPYLTAETTVAITSTMVAPANTQVAKLRLRDCATAALARFSASAASVRPGAPSDLQRANQRFVAHSSTRFECEAFALQYDSDSPPTARSHQASLPRQSASPRHSAKGHSLLSSYLDFGIKSRRTRLLPQWDPELPTSSSRRVLLLRSSDMTKPIDGRRQPFPRVRPSCSSSSTHYYTSFSN